MALIKDVVAELMQKQLDYDKKAQSPQVIEDCLKRYGELLDITPDDPLIIAQTGTGNLQLGRFGIAIQFFKRALSYLPANPHIWSNLGVCLRSLHRLREARDAFMKSLQLKENAETYSNMAACYINENCPEQGIKYAKRAMAMMPDNAKPKWNASLLYLEAGDWEKAFQLYDSGFFCNERPLRYYSNDHKHDVPWWDGTEGLTVGMWDEQGLGDRLLMYNLLREVEGKINVILECHPRLEGIVRRSFPWATVFPTSKDEFIGWRKGFKLEAKMPVMSLARMYWSGGNFNRTPYIKPDPELVAHYRAEMEKLGPGPYICFSWAGGSRKTNTEYRSLKLGWFEPLIRTGGTWLSMQYHDFARGKVERFREEKKLPVFHLDAAQEFNFDHTLAALAAADLTVSACNTVIHCCGAAGLPCWVLVPTRRAWRYPSGPHLPWYGDNVVQYHQEKDNDWAGVLGRVCADLQRWHQERRAA